MDKDQNPEEDPLVEISVSGTCFTVKKTMLLEQDWMLSRVLESNIPWALYHNGRFFIDQDPFAFRWVLHFTRCQSLPEGILASVTELEAIRSLADYLCFGAMLSYVEKAIFEAKSQVELLKNTIKQIKADHAIEIAEIHRSHLINPSDSYEIIVHSAGTRALHGIYTLDGTFQGACKYSMQGDFNGTICCFTLFLCTTRFGTNRWYISITGDQPGTENDIDFYRTAPVRDSFASCPPVDTWEVWQACGTLVPSRGLYPPPKLVFKRRSKEAKEEDDNM